MKYKVVIPDSKSIFAESEDVKREIHDVQAYLDKGMMEFEDGIINLGVLAGEYEHDARSMNVMCLLANGLDIPIEELHGTIILKLAKHEALVARTTFDFSKDFMGVLQPHQAMLIHFTVPVKGLLEDTHISTREFMPDIIDVRYTPENRNEGSE